MYFIALILSIALLFVSGKRREAQRKLIETVEREFSDDEKDIEEFDKLEDYMDYKYGNETLSEVKLGAETKREREPNELEFGKVSIGL